jgi:DNA-binding beta-propeller fold protein YncE
MSLLAGSACSKDDNPTTSTIEVKQESYTLPGDQLFPEGIAYNPDKGNFYVGSTTNGDVVQVNVTTGAASVFAAGAAQARTDCRGMKVDSRGRLWVAGGAENKIHVLNPDGTLLKTWDTRALFNSGFINDCAVDANYVYFTDSRVQKVYRAAVSGATPGEVEEWLTFTDQQIPYGTGFNANGITMTPDGRYLMVVISNSGKLYRIDRTSKAIAEITLNQPLTAGDGLWLLGNTLYVSRNSLGLIFPVTLDAAYTQGTVGTGFGTNLKFNTTIAPADKYFLVLNSQLNLRPSGTTPPPAAPTLPFTVSRVTIP